MTVPFNFIRQTTSVGWNLKKSTICPGGFKMSKNPLKCGVRMTPCFKKNRTSNPPSPQTSKVRTKFGKFRLYEPPRTLTFLSHKVELKPVDYLCSAPSLSYLGNNFGYIKGRFWKFFVFWELPKPNHLKKAFNSRKDNLRVQIFFQSGFSKAMHFPDAKMQMFWFLLLW